MIALYIILACVIIVLVLGKRFNFLSVFALSFLFYTSNCVYGEVYFALKQGLPHALTELEPITYINIIIQQLIVIAFLFRDKQKKLDTEKTSLMLSSGNGFNEFPFIVFTAFSIFAFLYDTFINIGIANLASLKKADYLMYSSTLLRGGYIHSVLVVFVYSIYCKKKYMLAISSIILIAVLITGSRTYFGVALIFFLVYISNKYQLKLFKNKKLLFGGLFAILFLLLFKTVYYDILAGNYSAVFDALANPSTYAFLLENRDSRLYLLLYNYCATTDFHLPFHDVFVRLLSAIPFVNDHITTIYPLRFSTMAYSIFDAWFGPGGNFFGESILMFGQIGAHIMFIIMLLIINMCDKQLIKGKVQTTWFLGIFASYVSFFTVRADFTQILAMAKIQLFVYLIYRFLRLFRIKKKSNIHSYSNKSVLQGLMKIEGNK